MIGTKVKIISKIPNIFQMIFLILYLMYRFRYIYLNPKELLKILNME